MNFGAALKQKTHSWQGAYYFVCEALEDNPDISYKSLWESAHTQHALRKLIHTHGVEHVKNEVEKLFNDVKASR